MKLYAGIDLHSSNCYLGIIVDKSQKVVGKRLRNSVFRLLSIAWHLTKRIFKASSSNPLITGIGWSMGYRNMVTRFTWPILRR